MRSDRRAKTPRPQRHWVGIGVVAMTALFDQRLWRWGWREVLGTEAHTVGRPKQRHFERGPIVRGA